MDILQRILRLGKEGKHDVKYADYVKIYKIQRKKPEAVTDQQVAAGRE